ncbi:LysR family transcriptional regulator [Pseudomonas fildesensis]|uniref:LysR family transcriptional regulator n=1 Tax=Pseudomonas fildesensis TaxID=1674920 RepID=UPI00387ADDAA
MEKVIWSHLGDRRATLEHLRTFATIALDGGFISASKKLHRSQSAITQNLKKLEQIVGCTLLERRQGRVIGLTDEGKRFPPQVNEILNTVSVAIGTLQKSPVRALVRLGVPDDFSIANIHSALSNYLAVNPQLKVEVHAALSDHILALVSANELDIALFKRTTNFEENGFAHQRPLITESLHWVGRENINFHKTHELPLILFPDGCSYRRAALEVLRKENKQVKIAYTGSSYENIKKAVSAGLGVAILPYNSITKNEVILGEEHEFPPLPNSKLIIVINSSGDIYKPFADHIIRSYQGNFPTVLPDPAETPPEIKFSI